MLYLAIAVGWTLSALLAFRLFVWATLLEFPTVTLGDAAFFGILAFLGGPISVAAAAFSGLIAVADNWGGGQKVLWRRK